MTSLQPLSESWCAASGSTQMKIFCCNTGMQKASLRCGCACAWFCWISMQKRGFRVFSSQLNSLGQRNLSRNFWILCQIVRMQTRKRPVTEPGAETYLRKGFATDLVVALVGLEVVVDSCVLLERRFLGKTLVAQIAKYSEVKYKFIKELKWLNYQRNKTCWPKLERGFTICI